MKGKQIIRRYKGNKVLCEDIKRTNEKKMKSKGKNEIECGNWNKRAQRNK